MKVNNYNRWIGMLQLAILLITGGLGVKPAPVVAQEATDWIRISSIEGITDTVEFHVGSPLFLRLEIHGGRACDYGNGRPFYFGEERSQLGWGFEEVHDSISLPALTGDGTCSRYVMLSSEASNRLAEGTYPVSVAILIDERSQIASDTIVLKPIHSDGADELSYSRFLLEQIVTNSPILGDKVTRKELFSPHLPHSFASDVYRALIYYLAGDLTDAQDAIADADSRVVVKSTGSVLAQKTLELVRHRIERSDE